MKKRKSILISRGEAALKKWAGALRAIFFAALVYRFLRPFYYNPLRYIFSDPQRHWENGQNLLHPTISCGLDNKLYQVYIHLLAAISGKQEGLIALYTGLLSAALALVWYRAAREMFSKPVALLFAILVAIHPSFTAIYNYLMPETLMLPLVGLGLWLTLRAARKNELVAALWAVLAWVMACYTRTIGIPMLLIALFYLMMRCPRPAMIFTAALVMMAAAAIPAGMQSKAGIGAFAPFGIGGALNGTYRKSGADTIHVSMYERGGWAFSSPSYYVNPFDPVGEYQSHRHKKSHSFSIRTGDGMAAWRAAYREAGAQYGWRDWLLDLRENAIFLFFAPSWPDNNPYAADDFPLRANYHLRWMWPPVMLIILLAAPFVRTDARRFLPLALGWFMLLALIFQQVGPMEGRYRKPLEPVWLLNLWIMAAAWIAPVRRSFRTLPGWIRYFLGKLSVSMSRARYRRSWRVKR